MRRIICCSLCMGTLVIEFEPTNVWKIEYTECRMVGAEKKCPPIAMESCIVVTLWTVPGRIILLKVRADTEKRAWKRTT